MDIPPEELRQQYGVFRVLIIGRRNAGKTTILKKMAGVEVGEEPEIRDMNGNLVKVNPALSQRENMAETVISG